VRRLLHLSGLRVKCGRGGKETRPRGGGRAVDFDVRPVECGAASETDLA
jgi:hypothetical protein